MPIAIQTLIHPMLDDCTSAATVPKVDRTVSDSTPVIIGVGQFTERTNDPDYVGLAPYELAARAARRACDDAGAACDVTSRIDAIASTRTFEDSGAVPATFGKSNNFPRSIAKRLGISPPLAIWSRAGGDTPQTLVIDLCRRLASGQIRMALMAGAEAISTVRHLSRTGQSRDFNDSCAGSVEDHGSGVEELLRPHHLTYGLASAPAAYALCENARRARLGLSKQCYAQEMGRLFAPFTQVAAQNPYSSSQVMPLTAEQVIENSERNRMIVEPYRLRLVARDQVNQAAAVLLTTVGLARELGVPDHKRVFVHGSALLAERELMERQDLGVSPAARLASQSALADAGVSTDDIGYFDFYSCFPIAVFNVAHDSLGLSSEDPRQLTLTGGLPYFGGPGNNYSMHAIASLTEKLRTHPGSYGFIGANGGFLSKYAAAVYSTRPAPWREGASAQLQREIDARPAPLLLEQADGEGYIETYTIVYKAGQPATAIIVGRLTSEEQRFLALSDPADPATLQFMADADPLRAPVRVRSTAEGNRFVWRRD